MRTELGDKYVDDLFGVWNSRVPHEADLVTYWFEKAREYVEERSSSRAGLLATQGIRGGPNRKVLERIKNSGNIFWAQSDRDWILEGANVHISMVAFDDGSESLRELDGDTVSEINADLTSNTDLTAAVPLHENCDLAFMGVTRIGPFELDPEAARILLALPPNPHGRPNSDVVRKWANGLDVTRRPRGMWIIDFGTDRTVNEAAMYEGPFERIKRCVYPERQNNNRESYREKWWLFGEPRPAMRRALRSLSRYIATPLVSKHRVFVWLGVDTVPENLLTAIARSDDYFFGVLHSRVHEIWALKKGTALEDRPRYTATSTFETFPFPWPPGKEPQDDARVKAIATAAKELVEKRDAWLNPPGATETELKKRTLTNLYNQRPQWLDNLHRALDDAVFAAYGWPDTLADTEILERLLVLNHERAELRE